MVPAVTVLMSVYNGEPYVREAIQSILCQSFQDFELVIVDDGSSDGTAGVIDRLCLVDCRIRRIANQRNLGLVQSLNLGLAASRGRFVARMDADDIAAPNRLALQVNALLSKPHVNYVTCQVGIVEQDGRQLNGGPRPGNPELAHWYLQFYNYIGGHGLGMYRRSSILEAGSYRDNLWSRYCEDYELWTRLLEPCTVEFLAEELLLYRRHPNAIGIRHAAEQVECVIEVARRQQSDLLGVDVSPDIAREGYMFWSEPKRFSHASRSLAQHHEAMLVSYVRRFSHQYSFANVEGLIRSELGGRSMGES